MVPSPWSQSAYAVRFDWGLPGARAVADADGILVVVDVLSFTTSVDVAVGRGMTVLPAPWGDEAAELALARGAALAVGRGNVGPTTPYSLSPAALAAAPFTERLVLPSPNGSAIAAAVTARVVLAASLRNASAVALWLAARARDLGPITVIAAGERWPDDSLRPAVEDALGAGAVIARLVDAGLNASPEAAAVAAQFSGTPDVGTAVRDSASGRELIARDFAGDIDMAIAIDSSACVPVLVDGAFRC